MNPKYLSTQFISKATLYLSVGLYLISLSQSCICISGECGEKWQGILILLSGVLGFFVSPAGFAWLANPFLFMSWRIKKSRIPFIYSFLATAFATSFLFFKTIVSDEGGGLHPITGYQLGYWLWLSSCWISFGGSAIVFYLKNRAFVIQR